MRSSLSSVPLWSVLFFLVCGYLSDAVAQPAQPPAIRPLITQAVDDTQRIPIRGNTHPLAISAYDRGMAPPTLALERMLLVMKHSPEQDAALTRLLDDQQDKSSPNYHHWLTPEEFGRRFGAADADVQSITAWLTSHGFQVGQVSKGRSVIEFSGTAAMVQEAFHTAIHKYAVQGEQHWANASDPEIPSALAPAVAGVWSLHNFRKKPMLVMSGERFPLTYPPGAKTPLATGSNGQHFLSPGDYAVIYGIDPVYNAGVTGNSVTIAVVARTEISFTDISEFSSIFGTIGNIRSVNNGPSPGDLGGGEEAEAVLDSTWSAAIAKGATVDLVVSASTDSTDGIDLSELYIIDNNLGDIMTESFGFCEAAAGTSQLTGISALAQQAAAQGITYLVSSGDTGAAGCDNLGETLAKGPLSVNALASPPYTLAVGGTIFNENTHSSTYWSSSTTTPVTALKYIPENVWNESCTPCSHPSIAAGGGGPSGVVAKPFWQAGVSGIPADGFRDVPDVSLTAAIHDPYLLCLDGSCGQGFLVGIGGTSASAPSFAGIMALVDQQMGGRVGAANYVLYRLAASQTASQCNASSTTTAPASTCVFNDVTTGNNAVPGEASFGTNSPQFAATAGYDLATGLGSVIVSNLVNKWSSVTFSPSTTALTVSPQTGLQHGSQATVSVTVTAQGSSKSTPSGDVALMADAGTAPPGLSVDRLTLGAGGTITSVTSLLPGGTNNITAHYAGDATFAPSDSAPVQVTVSPEPSTATVKALTADANGLPTAFTSGPYGSFVYLRADVAGSSGVGTPTGTLNFLDNGTTYLAGISLNSQGTATTPSGVFNFSTGTHSIAAQYFGDASFQPMSAPSAAVAFTITKAATTTTVQPITAPIASGTSATLTATVSAAGGGNSPTGTVLFFNGGTQLPGSASLFSSPSSAAGTVQATAILQSALPDGQDSITAQYTDDANYTGSTSAAVTVTVAPDFSLSMDSATVTVTSPGLSGSANVTITGQTGYTGTVNFSSASCTGLPLGAACSFAPASVTGSGTTKLTISTLAAHVAPPARPVAFNRWMAGGGLLFAGVFFLAVPSRRHRLSMAAGLLVLAWLMTAVGCSGGGGGHSSGTPVGSYQITVTAAGQSFSHQISFTLTVQ